MLICLCGSNGIVGSFPLTHIVQMLKLGGWRKPLFGNWGRAVARAGELGMDGWLTRFRDWGQVKAQIAAGQPVIASIRFKAGTFPSAVMRQTSGHLIVIRGFTPGGDVIVNDPASRERGNGAVYKADELARAWFDNGGVAYVIRRPGGTPVAIGPSNKE